MHFLRSSASARRWRRSGKRALAKGARRLSAEFASALEGFRARARHASERMDRATGARERRSCRKISGSFADHGRFLGDGLGASAQRTRAERNRIAAALGGPGAARFLLESVRWPGANAARTRDQCSGRRQRRRIYAGWQSRRLRNHRIRAKTRCKIHPRTEFRLPATDATLLLEGHSRAEPDDASC